jgi:aminopeptidase N
MSCFFWLTLCELRKNILLNFSEYSNANEDHLHEAINEELQATKPELDVDVASVMHTWTLQAGYPLVTIISEDNELIITQVSALLTQFTPVMYVPVHR